MTNVLGIASIMTLYQAGNEIYKLFDKVLILEGGKEIYYGPLMEARPFMEALGFICRDGSNVADYLTGVTVPTERLVRPKCLNTYPLNGNLIQAEYEKSPIYAEAKTEYAYPSTDVAKERTKLFKQAVAAEKSRQLPKSSPTTVSFPK